MDFNDALVKFVEGVQEISNDYFAKHLTRLVPDLYQVEGGKKYIKISKTDNGGEGSKSVHSFIVTVDDPRKGQRMGDVLKPASWKAPARHARGNIFSDKNGLEAVNDHGWVNYL
jgi:hypothetical protein